MALTKIEAEAIVELSKKEHMRTVAFLTGLAIEVASAEHQEAKAKLLALAVDEEEETDYQVNTYDAWAIIELCKKLKDFRAQMRSALAPYWASNPCVGDDEILAAIKRLVQDWWMGRRCLC